MGGYRSRRFAGIESVCNHRTERLAAHEMHVQVVNLLPGVLVAIDDEPVAAIGDAFPFRQVARHGVKMADQRFVCIHDVVRGWNYLVGHDENMYGRARADVPGGSDAVVPVHDLGGHFACNDSLEQVCHERDFIQDSAPLYSTPLKLNIDSLATHLERQLLPAYLISGDEPLLAAEAADAVRARARDLGFTERETYFIERAADWADVRASASNLSLFAAKRVIEIRLNSAKLGVAGGAALTAVLKTKDPDRVLLILAPKMDREAQNAEWARTVEGSGASVQVWPVDAAHLVGWLRTRCAKLKLAVPDDALEILAERTEGNLLAANQELAKLRLMVRGNEVSTQDVLTSVADSARF